LTRGFFTWSELYFMCSVLSVLLCHVTFSVLLYYFLCYCILSQCYCTLLFCCAVSCYLFFCVLLFMYIYLTIYIYIYIYIYCTLTLPPGVNPIAVNKYLSTTNLSPVHTERNWSYVQTYAHSITAFVRERRVGFVLLSFVFVKTCLMMAVRPKRVAWLCKEFLGSFAKLLNVSCPSVCPHGTSRLPLDGFSWS
jgi:hypothetical protein